MGKGKNCILLTLVVMLSITVYGQSGNQLTTSDSLNSGILHRSDQGIGQKELKRVAGDKARIDSLRLITKAYPVMGFFNDTLFVIYNNLGSFSAKDRAEAISERIAKLPNGFIHKSDSLKVIESENTYDIVSGERIVMSVTGNDAIWTGLSKLEMAELYQKKITEAVINYQSETSLSKLAVEIGLALLVIVITSIIIRYTKKLFNWTALKIKETEGKHIKGIKIRNYNLFDAKQQVDVLLFVNTIFKWISILLLVYIAIPILFGIFPWTKNLASVLLDYILSPVKSISLGLWNYLPNLITIIVIVVVFRYVFKGLHFLKMEIETGNLTIDGFYPDWANPTFQIIKGLLYAFMFIVIFPYLPGSDSPIFKGVSVFLGVLFTFGSSGSLSNVMAGLVLTYMRAFKIGDRVKIGDVTGDIIEKSLLVTRIRTIKNEIISIPNSNIMSSHTINYSSEAAGNGLVLYTTVTIGYDVPWKNMHQALIDAALRTDFLLKDPSPFVLQTSLDDFYVSYQINAYTCEANKQAMIYSQLHQNIQDCCNEAGIEILSPHYRAERDGNMTTIPSDYLGKDYEAPTFNVQIKTKIK